MTFTAGNLFPSHTGIGWPEFSPYRDSNPGPQHERRTTYHLSYPSPLHPHLLNEKNRLLPVSLGSYLFTRIGWKLVKNTLKLVISSLPIHALGDPSLALTGIRTWVPSLRQTTYHLSYPSPFTPTFLMKKQAIACEPWLIFIYKNWLKVGQEHWKTTAALLLNSLWTCNSWSKIVTCDLDSDLDSSSMSVIYNLIQGVIVVYYLWKSL